MGTRADFYVGRGPNAEWIGSTAWDGYPSGIEPTHRSIVGCRQPMDWPEGGHLFASVTPEQFRERVEQYFAHREDVTRPADGWPWPWETSATTDFAYAFDDGKVYASCFGNPWFDPSVPKNDEEDDEAPDRGPSAVFPNMNTDRAVMSGSRSGLIVLQR